MNNSKRVALHLPVTKSQDRKPQPTERLLLGSILLTAETMALTINFNDQTQFRAVEIRDPFENRLLPVKIETEPPPGSQVFP
jgi:hypothetical protein